MKVSNEELDVYMKMHNNFLRLVGEGYYGHRDYIAYVRNVVRTHEVVLEELNKIDEKLFGKELEKVLSEDDE